VLSPHAPGMHGEILNAPSLVDEIQSRLIDSEIDRSVPGRWKKLVKRSRVSVLEKNDP